MGSNAFINKYSDIVLALIVVAFTLVSCSTRVSPSATPTLESRALRLYATSASLPLLEDADGMPVGVQLVGAPHDDARLLRTANWLIQAVAPKGKRRSQKS